MNRKIKQYLSLLLSICMLVMATPPISLAEDGAAPAEDTAPAYIVALTGAPSTLEAIYGCDEDELDLPESLTAVYSDEAQARLSVSWVCISDGLGGTAYDGECENYEDARFSFEARRRTGDDVLMVKDLRKGFEGRTLFENFNLHLRAGDRVAIIGPNGVGKSTLLNIIARQLPPDNGTVVYGSNVDLGYYEQHQTKLHPDKDILNEIWDDFPRLEIDRVRGVLALFLLTGDDVFQPIRTLSGGEKGRVSLAKLMLRHDNFLLMDEPTNHLDMDSREVLEGALEDFDGTILTVSHDRYFINRVANRVVEMTPEGAKEYIGNYDDYLEKKRLEEAGIEEEAYGGKTKTQIDKEKRKARLAKESEKALRLKLKNAEEDVARTEEEIARLEAQMGDPETYRDSNLAQQVAKDHRAAQQRLDELYEIWEELSEAVAELE